KFKVLSEVSEIASKNYKTQILASQIGRADAKKIIRARLDWAKMRTDLSETEALKNQLADKLKQMGIAPDSLNSSDWLSPQEMKAKISDLPENTISISQKLSVQEYQDLLHDYELSQGERYSLIDSIELAYSHLEN